MVRIKCREAKAFGISLIAFGLVVGTAYGQAPQAAASPVPWPEVLNSYVQVVGGAVAGVMTLFGAPFLYQNYRKSNAEIRKLNLESQQMERQIPPDSDASRDDEKKNGFEVRVVGERNVVHVTADPRLAAPIVVLLDAFTEFFYFEIVMFAIDALPIYPPDLIMQPVKALIFFGIFFPILRLARRAKTQVGNIEMPQTRVVGNDSCKLGAKNSFFRFLL